MVVCENYKEKCAGNWNTEHRAPSNAAPKDNVHRSRLERLYAPPRMAISSDDFPHIADDVPSYTAISLWRVYFNLAWKDAPNVSICICCMLYVPCALLLPRHNAVFQSANRRGINSHTLLSFNIYMGSAGQAITHRLPRTAICC